MKLHINENVQIEFINVISGNGILISYKIVDRLKGTERWKTLPPFKQETLVRIAEIISMDQKTREVLFGVK